MSILRTLADGVRQLVKRVAFTAVRLALRLERRCLVVYYAWPDFERRARAIAFELRRAGFPVVVRHGLSRAVRFRVQFSKQLHIGFWNIYPHWALPRRYVFFNAEPLHIAEWRSDERVNAMKHAWQVWDFSRANEPFHAAVSDKLKIVPFGYSAYYEELFERATVGVNEEDIDVLFVGLMTPRRLRLIEPLKTAGFRLHLVTETQPVFGDELYRLFRRSKIVLCPYSHDNPATHIADLARLDILLSNGRLVLHERPSNPDEFADFIRVVPTFAYDEASTLIARFLADPSLRHETARAGRDWFRADVALAKSLPVDDLRAEFARSG